MMELDEFVECAPMDQVGSDLEESSTKRIPRREVDTTEQERIQLFHYSQKHPKSTQRDLVQWFATSFNKQINQSTISHMP